MTTAFREFKGHEWLGKGINLRGGTLFLIKDTQWQGVEAAVQFGGRKASVYQGRHQGRLVAVKAFHRAFALADNFLSMLALRPFADVPGLAVCNRDVVRDEEAVGAGASGLSWSVVMPWIDGQPWAAYIDQKLPIDPPTCLALAQQTAKILAGLERHDLAHADLSAGNVIVTRLAPSPAIELIDVEDMFHPTFKTPTHVPDGTPGYGHPANRGKGCFNPYGDRFAGAILLVEMLTWHDPEIRASAADLSLFEQAELCQPTAKYRMVRNTVAMHSNSAAALLDRAWHSSGLSECPTLADWNKALADATAPRTVAQWTPRLAFDMPALTHLKGLLNQEQLQTSFVATVECDECGAQIRRGNPSDHRTVCSHHPKRVDWRSMLFDRPAMDDKATALQGLLKRFSPGSTLCDECFRFVTGPLDSNHADGCAASWHTPTPPAPVPPARELPRFDDITFRPLDASEPPELPPPWSLGAREQRWCTGCHRPVTRGLAGIEIGHTPQCPQRGPFPQPTDP
jgi:endogenous inhibitor of DNA gyrase (YacG/DUF329 family)